MHSVVQWNWLLTALSDLARLDIRTRNGLYPLLFVNVGFKFFKCSVLVLLSSAKKSVTNGRRS